MLLDWKSSTTYAKGNVVVYNDDIYQALNPNTNRPPPGNDWKLLIGSSDAIASTRWLSDAYAPGIDITAYGAVGDGVTDNYAAIQAALNAEKAIFIPDGDFYIGTELRPPSGSRIYGNGPTSRLVARNIVQGLNGQEMIVLDGVSNVVIERIALDNSGQTNWQAGTRCIYAQDASHFLVRDCHITANGAAFAAIRSSYYEFSHNYCTWSATDNSDHHDGFVDQWWGSNNFRILYNRIVGLNQIIDYGILATGTNSDGSAGAPLYNFLIHGNIVEGARVNNIWVNGRSGVNHHFVISSNISLDAGQGLIRVEDSEDFTIANNVASGSSMNGIIIGQEAAPHSGCKRASITGNQISDINLVGGGTYDGMALGTNWGAVQDAIFTGNVVSGSGHKYGLYFGINALNTYESGNIISVGTSGGRQAPATSSSSAAKLESKYFTTTITAVTANVTGTALGASIAEVSAEIITVFFKVSITTNGAGAASVRMTLPYANSAINDSDTWLFGSASTSGSLSAMVNANDANNQAELLFNSPGAGTYVFTGQYAMRTR